MLGPSVPGAIFRSRTEASNFIFFYRACHIVPEIEFHQTLNFELRYRKRSVTDLFVFNGTDDDGEYSCVVLRLSDKIKARNFNAFEYKQIRPEVRSVRGHADL